MSQKTTGSVYNETYHYYLNQLETMQFDGKEDVLGIKLQGDEVVVPYFGQSIRLTAEGLKDDAGNRPDFADCVVVCRYLIMCPPFEPKEKDWVAYRDFSDAGPLTVFWADSVEGPLARIFSGNVGALGKACEALGGSVSDMDISCDLCRRFTPLPKTPLLLVFNDADDDFPASASLLFEKRASTYLDAESQAVLGHVFSNRLLAAMGGR
ncbi:MAG: DUF3786 domain-containing protein [Desulfosarcina sp.]|nr:DUF3786 domain-containing protein [Desulfosarcina sp.]MBC2744159.1 DUF3786 domain-containing protein [Desulfosarcina sp.]MBC2767068.1 DUF3786 domain-containing protein [Desulfosarcina sp.]